MMKKASLNYRSVIPEARRVVIKIGSRVLVQKTGRPDKRRMRSLIKDMAAIQAAGHEVVVVTSGAVGAGMEALGMKTRPQTVPELQMAAAIGQTRLMSCYDSLFGKYGYKVGQVLLTHSNFKHKVRQTNARRTMESLIRNKVIPIINENDVVADEEMRAVETMGDNDYLATLVVKLIRADLLILLTTVDGLREPAAQNRTRRVKYLESVTRKTYALVNSHDSHISKGGMATKLKAAATVAQAGCCAVIANGRTTGVLSHIMAGEDTGTLILASTV
jgi:glutamate 5-kinase